MKIDMQLTLAIQVTSKKNTIFLGFELIVLLQATLGQNFWLKLPILSFYSFSIKRYLT